MKTRLAAEIAWGGGIIVLALVATLARNLGYIDDDTSSRIVLGAIGIMVAWYGNRMPKAFVPDTHRRQVNRVAGWSLALSGLVYAVVWAFAPMNVALWVGCGAIIAGMIVTIAYCRSLRERAETTG